MSNIELIFAIITVILIMESIPKSPLFEFPSNTLYNVRKAYDLEKPGDMVAAVNILEEWIQKQDHFLKKDFSKYNLTFIYRVLIQSHLVIL